MPGRIHAHDELLKLVDNIHRRGQQLHIQPPTTESRASKPILQGSKREEKWKRSKRDTAQGAEEEGGLVANG